MISYLKGHLHFSDQDSLTVEVSGVGYEVHVSSIVREKLFGQSQAELFIHTSVREDAITLFGFTSPQEKQLFLTLIKVNGVGPKMALSILSGAPMERILQLIESEDVKGLTQLPKVGKKTAEQLILSLKGKLPQVSEGSNAPKLSKALRPDIQSALLNLGFRSQDIEIVVEGLPPGIDFEDGVRRSLVALSRGG